MFADRLAPLVANASSAGEAAQARRGATQRARQCPRALGDAAHALTPPPPHTHTHARAHTNTQHAQHKQTHTHTPRTDHQPRGVGAVPRPPHPLQGRPSARDPRALASGGGGLCLVLGAVHLPGQRVPRGRGARARRGCATRAARALAECAALALAAGCFWNARTAEAASRQRRHCACVRGPRARKKRPTPRGAGIADWPAAARAGAGRAAGRFNNHNWVEVWDGRGWSFTGARGALPRGRAAAGAASRRRRGVPAVRCHPPPPPTHTHTTQLTTQNIKHKTHDRRRVRVRPRRPQPHVVLSAARGARGPGRPPARHLGGLLQAHAGCAGFEAATGLVVCKARRPVWRGARGGGVLSGIHLTSSTPRARRAFGETRARLAPT